MGCRSDKLVRVETQSLASSNFPQSDAATDVVVARQATIAAEENVFEKVIGLNYQLAALQACLTGPSFLRQSGCVTQR